MSVYFFHHNIGGKISSNFVLEGERPLPWIKFDVVTYAFTWDRSGHRTRTPMTVRVVVQGTENIKKLKPKIILGRQVVIIGAQAIPAKKVMKDFNKRSIVTLASSGLIQFPDEDER